MTPPRAWPPASGDTGARASWPVWRWVAITALLVIVAAVAYLVLAWPSFRLPFVGIEATLRLQATSDGETITVSGVTDVPDGARVNCDVGPATDAGGRAAWSEDVEVRGGMFAFDKSVPDGAATTTVDCFFGTVYSIQPAHVLERFGAEMERLSGPQVYVDSPGDPKQLRATIALVAIGIANASRSEVAVRLLDGSGNDVGGWRVDEGGMGNIVVPDRDATLQIYDWGNGECWLYFETKDLAAGSVRITDGLNVDYQRGTPVARPVLPTTAQCKGLASSDGGEPAG